MPLFRVTVVQDLMFEVTAEDAERAAELALSMDPEDYTGYGPNELLEVEEIDYDS